VHSELQGLAAILHGACGDRTHSLTAAHNAFAISRNLFLILIRIRCALRAMSATSSVILSRGIGYSRYGIRLMHKFPGIATRLKRAQGHLSAVIDMLESGRPCMDLAQQLHAVEKAIGNAKKELIKDHIHHCMEETSEALPREFRDLIKEFQGVTKYL
jgi:DNA-binding FrmR family transcriptional regulator